jgi:peptide/nickel transport system permease protein
VLAFLARRLFQSVFVLIGITLFVSFTIRLSGDPAVAMFQGSSAPTAEQLVMIRERLGTDRPFIQQYLSFVAGVVRGDLGTSFRTGGPVADAVGQRFPATVGLALAALAISLVVAVPLGVMAARRRGTVLDLGVRIVTLLGLSFPNFWLGIMLILIFGVHLRWLPPSGLEGPISYVLPSLTLGLILASTTTRLVRSALLDVLGEQYVVTARAKGITESRVVYRHALRTALIPVVTFIGLQMGGLIGGVVIIEQVFAWPGLGSLALSAISFRDYPMLQGTITVLAVFIAAINLLVDMSYALLDPRIRYA